MAETISAIYQMKRMTKEQWKTSPYIPREGESVCELDTGFVKVGDGVHRFSELKYLTGPQGEQGPQGIQGPPGKDGVVTFEALTKEQRDSLKGDKGERGEQGPPGPRGATGEPGQRGATGERGAIGEKGATGERGPVGPPGPRGADGIVNYASQEAQQTLSEYAKTAEIPVYRFCKFPIDLLFPGDNLSIKKTSLENPDGVKVGDTIEGWWINKDKSEVQKSIWTVQKIIGDKIEIIGIVKRMIPIYNDKDITRRISALESRPSPQGFVNQKTGQPLKYWFGSKSEYDAISNKDASTVYDYYE